MKEKQKNCYARILVHREGHLVSAYVLGVVVSFVVFQATIVDVLRGADNLLAIGEAAAPMVRGGVKGSVSDVHTASTHRTQLDFVMLIHLKMKNTVIKI